MREADETDVVDAPTWSLWLVSAICFGPLTLVRCLGLLAIPVFRWG